jgi:hypothetical protein
MDCQDLKVAQDKMDCQEKKAQQDSLVNVA